MKHDWYLVHLRFCRLRVLTNEDWACRLIRRNYVVMSKRSENDAFADWRIHQTNSTRISRM